MSWTRERTMGSFVPITGVQYNTDFNGNTTVVGSYSVGQIGSTKRTRDTPTSNFEARRKMGETVINPFSSLVETRASGLAGWAYYTTKPPYTGSVASASCNVPRYYITVSNGVIPTVFYLSTSEISALRALAGTQAMANIAKPDVEGAVFLAELGKTASLISDRANLLRTRFEPWFKHLRRLKRPRGAADLLSLISSEWLKYRYGIRPLMMDIEAAVTLLQKRTSSDIRTARGYAGNQWSQTTGPSLQVDSMYEYNVSIKQDTSYSVRAGVRYKVKGHVDGWGVSLPNTPSVLWELLPYSFVVDWFLNTSSYIRALQPKIDIEILGSWTTAVQTTNLVRTINAQQRSLTGVTSTVLPGGTDSHLSVHKQRALGVTTELVVDPAWTTKLQTATRSADALSLIYQRLARTSR